MIEPRPIASHPEPDGCRLPLYRRRPEGTGGSLARCRRESGLILPGICLRDPRRSQRSNRAAQPPLYFIEQQVLRLEGIDPRSRGQLEEPRVVARSQSRRMTRDHVESPATLSREDGELLPPQCASRLGWWELIADQQQPFGVRIPPRCFVDRLDRRGAQLRTIARTERKARSRSPCTPRPMAA